MEAWASISFWSFFDPAFIRAPAFTRAPAFIWAQPLFEPNFY